MFNLFQLLHLDLDLDSCPFDAEILLLKTWIYFFLIIIFKHTYAENILLLAS